MTVGILRGLRIDSRLWEVAAFAAVGLTASVVHFAAAVLLIEEAGLRPWLANMVAFLTALPVSYLGHAFLTFSARRYGRAASVTGQSAGRFLALALTGFLLNQTGVLLLVEGAGLPHRPALAAVIVAVAGFLYLASKFWAFRGRQA
ncbi:GtrA family protein [Chthonobacter rhizosphaerae]|uniref:GtrA family protein n=1 Tax=Chthonobacter rhizosphaerae TaxID=2735553 RepID=UPI0015EF60AB|nr:GtrA family protein [Chthonobacter rhizosphaerae]